MTIQRGLSLLLVSQVVNFIEVSSLFDRVQRHCQVDEGGLLSFNLALLDGGRMIGTR
jgi:hypothetical protein